MLSCLLAGTLMLSHALALGPGEDAGEEYPNDFQYIDDTMPDDTSDGADIPDITDDTALTKDDSTPPAEPTAPDAAPKDELEAPDAAPSDVPAPDAAPADGPSQNTPVVPAPDTQEPAPEPEPEPIDSPEFSDISGHWAEKALKTASEHGLLTGSNGKLNPDGIIKLSEAIAILNRTLGASKADSTSGLNIPAGAWYANDIGKALHMGLIKESDQRHFDKAATRAEAFVLLCRAFSYDGVPVTTALKNFVDISSMSDEQLTAAASLVSAGVVSGLKADRLSPNSQLSRAQFVTMLLRAAPNFVDEISDVKEIQTGALITAANAAITETTLAGSQIFASGTSSVTLAGVDGSSRIVLKGSESATLNAASSSLGVLVLDPAGNASATLDAASKASALVVPGKGGSVTFNGTVGGVQITSNNRTINLSGLNPNAIIVTGSGNTIVFNGTATSLTVEKGASNNKFEINGPIQTLTVNGKGTALNGSGKAGTLTLNEPCEVNIDANSKKDNTDSGLQGLKVVAGVPTKVKPGESLVTQFKFTGIQGTKTCSYQWYQDGKPIPGGYTPSFAVSDGSYVRRTTNFTFKKGMQKSVTMGLMLAYTNQSTGKSEQVFTEVTVPIENYPDKWYDENDVDRVLKLVSSTYRGNYTTSYAVNNDYSNTEKEVWINAKGYSSRTQYLCWINRAYQHVNIFSGSKGNWKLIKSCVVGTGASGTPTPTGLTYVTYKSKSGWTTGNYTVRPVIGFYPDTGYAFHSRLCYPGTMKEYDFSSGYPVSHGCVRMQRNDIDWMYNNIPVGTAVVIF